MSWMHSTKKAILSDKVESSDYLCQLRENHIQPVNGQRKAVIFLTEL